jgi:glucosamine--fructose-6-phosphate aminotransferase (isomerizing)
MEDEVNNSTFGIIDSAFNSGEGRLKMVLMRDEIFEQPKAMETALKGGRMTTQEIARRVNALKPEFVYIAARGSSDNAAVFARYIFEAYTGLPVALAAPSLFTLYRRLPNLKKAWVIGISQSGQSEDIVTVLRDARQQGAFTSAITNDPASPLAESANTVLELNVGKEKSVAATKTYTAQLALMASLAAEISDNAGLRYGLERLPDAISHALNLDDHAQEVATRSIYRDAQNAIVLGRGYNFATALEVALKMKETAYVFAAPYSAADFMHGPFALTSENLPIVMLGTSGPSIPGLIEISKKLHERGAELIIVSDDNSLLKMATENGANLPLKLEGIPEALSPIVCVVPGQLLALHLALARSYDPDKPRGLQKVTSTV